MNFEGHFLEQDVPVANVIFSQIITSLKLIDSYSEKGDEENAARTSAYLASALADLNELACRRVDNNDMYLHHLLTQPQGWYPV